MIRWLFVVTFLSTIFINTSTNLTAVEADYRDQSFKFNFSDFDEDDYTSVHFLMVL